MIIKNLAVTWCHRPVNNEQNKSREAVDAKIVNELDTKKMSIWLRQLDQT